MSNACGDVIGLESTNETAERKDGCWLNDRFVRSFDGLEYRNHVWSYDFVHCGTELMTGKAFRTLNILDEHTVVNALAISGDSAG